MLVSWSLFFTFFGFSINCSHLHISEKLYDEIALKSRPYILPANFNNSRVWLYVDLYQILEVNEKSGTIVLKLTKIFFYQREDLAWDPEEYGGTQALEFPLNTFWVAPISKSWASKLYFFLYRLLRDVCFSPVYYHPIN